MTEKIETILAEEKGILPNLMDSSREYASCSPRDRKKWEAEFNHWLHLMSCYSYDIAEKYRKKFDELKSKFD